MAITVFEPADTDRDNWARLYRAYAEFYQLPMADDTLDTVWQWIHDDTMPFWCRLVRLDNQPAIGLMHFRAMPSPLRGCQVGFLDDLFVDPSARGNGAVDALFDELTRESSARGWPAVRWITADDNYRARAVYDRRARKTAWNTYQLDIEG